MRRRDDLVIGIGRNRRLVRTGSGHGRSPAQIWTGERRRRSRSSLCALAPLRSGVGRRAAAAPVGAEIGLGPDEPPRAGDDAENPPMQAVGGDRLDHELGHARIPGRHHALALGMPGQHDDRGEGAGIRVRLPDHLDEIQSVEHRHRPVDDHDVGREFGEGLEPAHAVRRLIDLARPEALQQRLQDAAHMRVVLDHQEAKLVELDSHHDAIMGAGAGSGPATIETIGALLTKD